MMGFILITFFNYTTTIARPGTMQINMPSDEPTDKPTAFIEESTITLIPVTGHKVVYYNGAITRDEQMLVKPLDNTKSLLMDKLFLSKN